MKSFQKAFGVLVLSGGLAVTGASAVAPKTALLPVEHDRGALVFEREGHSALLYEREGHSAVIIEHDRNNA